MEEMGSATSPMTSILSEATVVAPHHVAGSSPSDHLPAEGEPPCPFTAIAPLGGCVSVAMAPVPLRPLPEPAPTVGILVGMVFPLSPLLESSVFHPPRA
jgi:hypothetical protein